MRSKGNGGRSPPDALAKVALRSGKKRTPNRSSEFLLPPMDPYVHEKGERRSARVGPRTTIVAQMFALVKALRQKKRSGKGKGGNRPA